MRRPIRAALEDKQADGTWVAASPYLVIGTRVVRAVPAANLVPQGYISGHEAAAACAAAGKRLCTSAEWLAACRGPANTLYPYGDTHVDGACNDDYVGHPVVDYFGTSTGVWDSQHMNDPGINQQPGTVERGGARTACVSGYGMFDMHGNLHEWVSDAAGTFRGGFYADAKLNGSGCSYATTAHDLAHHWGVYTLYDGRSYRIGPGTAYTWGSYDVATATRSVKDGGLGCSLIVRKKFPITKTITRPPVVKKP